MPKPSFAHLAVVGAVLVLALLSRALSPSPLLSIASASPSTVLVVPAAGSAESIHLALGVPVATGPTDEHLVQRSQYALAYSPAHLGPAWVSWRLVAADFGGTPRHHGHFLTDTSLPAAWGDRITHDDFTGSGYQRGHLLPSEERTSSTEANDSTFLLSNVLPQTGALNDGPWRGLEKECRRLAEHDGRQLAILVGATYAAHPLTVGAHQIPVPVTFWKVVVIQAPGDGPADIRPDTPVLTAVMPNIDNIATVPWTMYRASVASLERLSGYRFFVRVPAAARAALEAK